MDQVLQETQRSRQMTNQIIQRIFPGHPGHGCLQEVLPFGEKVTMQKKKTFPSSGWKKYLPFCSKSFNLIVCSFK